ncbi:MAG: hypothetical protein U1E29_18355 [Coriobacteriia bacterium]|nr:hypothetical protein [Coriobacteriia bacterium]
MKREAAQDAFVAAIEELRALAARVAELPDSLLDTFGPDDVNWGHVGDVQHVVSELREVLGE